MSSCTRTTPNSILGTVVLAARALVTVSIQADCQPPPEYEEREVRVALRGERTVYRDDELVRLKKQSTIRPSLPDELADTGYSELMHYMLSSWSQFMSDRPDHDDKAGPKVTWKKRLQQLAAVVGHGRRKEEIMSLYGGHELHAAVTGTYWLGKLEFASLPLSRREEELMAAILGIVGPTRLYPGIRRCQLKQACACQFVACAPTSRAHGQLAALELRSKRFDWPESESLSTVAAAGVEYLALGGAGAFRNPLFWLRVFPAVKVLQCNLEGSWRSIGNVTTLLAGFQDKLLGLTLAWDNWPGCARDDEVWDAPLFAAVCAMLAADAHAPQISTDAFCSCFGSDHVAALLAMS
ncbi:unnamed protein product [Symbiodinium sp. CCMP2456]|nr:unnamed protein product [Symbiodinium sp. CCMP2456]